MTRTAILFPTYLLLHQRLIWFAFRQQTMALPVDNLSGLLISILLVSTKHEVKENVHGLQWPGP